MEPVQHSYVIDPNPPMFGNEIINKQYVGIGKVIRDVSIRNADNIHTYRLLKIEDKLYELDQEIFIIDYLTKLINQHGIEKARKKINYFAGLKSYLETCNETNEFLAYLTERKGNFERSREDVKIVLMASAKGLLKKSYDQKTQNELYYDSYDFKISSLDCLYDFLQKTSFDNLNDRDYIYDINSKHNLRLRNKSFEQLHSVKAESVEKIMVKPKAMPKRESCNTKEKANGEFDLSVNDCESEQEEPQPPINKPKIVVRKYSGVFKARFDDLRKIHYGELENVKKIVSLGFNNRYVVKLMVNLLIRRSCIFYDTELRVSLLVQVP